MFSVTPVCVCVCSCICSLSLQEHTDCMSSSSNISVQYWQRVLCFLTVKVKLEIAETKIISDPKLTHKSYLCELMMDSEQYTLNYAQILFSILGF